MKIRQAERPMGARLRLAREKCLCPRPVRCPTAVKKEFRQVVPNTNILFIPKGSSLCFEAVQAAAGREARFEQAQAESNERIRQRFYNLRQERAGHVR